jgi:hypothetical protein
MMLLLKGASEISHLQFLANDHGGSSRDRKVFHCRG